MQQNEFLASLGTEPGLFSFSKQDLDLLILAQLNTITISQLHSTGIHGETLASARLSLNRLAKKGLVLKKTIPNHNNLFYFTLTAKGRDYLKERLPETLFARLEVNWERRPPVGGSQLIHRILTSDFYCSYLSMPAALPTVWKTEEPLNRDCDHRETQPPRADGFLATKYADYYIEQDNHTQRESVLHQKIANYLENGIFDASKRKKVLVFTLTSPRAKLPNMKSNYTVYRMLLKVCQIWERFNTEQNLSLDYLQFYQLLASSSYRHGITETELMTLEQLHYIYPNLDDITTANALKKHYMDDTGYLEAVGREMDLQYNKRLKSCFLGFYKQNRRLMEHALTGNSIFAVPNHRLAQCQPFITSRECNLKEILLRTLFYNSLNIDGWKYHEPYIITSGNITPLYFARGFYHSSYGHIVFEFPGADLSSRQRLIHYQKHYSATMHNLVIILLGAEFLQQEIMDEYRTLFPANTYILYTKTLPCADNSSNTNIYFLHQPDEKVILECDSFDDTLRLLPKGDF